jgi:3-phenylpropionate/cinnamic acid dioxygenase small subunit
MESDRGEIENLLSRYCQLYDDGDLATYAALFDQGSISGPLGTLKGRDEVFEAQTRTCILYDGIPRTRHVITNIIIDVDDNAMTATASCYLTVFQEAPGFPLQVIFVGQYFDELKKIEGTWHFHHRRAVPHLWGDSSRTTRTPRDVMIRDGGYAEPTAGSG